jgi:hypothetical protein
LAVVFLLRVLVEYYTIHALRVVDRVLVLAVLEAVVLVSVPVVVVLVSAVGAAVVGRE